MGEVEGPRWHTRRSRRGGGFHLPLMKHAIAAFLIAAAVVSLGTLIWMARIDSQRGEPAPFSMAIRPLRTGAFASIKMQGHVENPNCPPDKRLNRLFSAERSHMEGRRRVWTYTQGTICCNGSGECEVRIDD